MFAKDKHSFLKVMTDILSSIFKAIDNGENIILYSAGGCGKTYTLREIEVYLNEKGRAFSATATTGVAAINLNIPEKEIAARTLHSWAGIGMARGTADKLASKILRIKTYRDRWINTDILIIDEVSMLGKELFEKLDYIGKRIRGKRARDKHAKPLGGIQLILSGDFLQLPPVKDEWVFQSEAWNDLNLKPFIFEEPKRYDDLEYFDLLLRVREGKHTEEDLRKLNMRVKAYDKVMNIINKSDSTDMIRPTVLYSRRIDVNSYNDKELAKLKTPVHNFISKDSFKPTEKGIKSDRYIGILNDSIPKVLSIKVGAQVMLKANLDVEGGLVNGSRGVVTGMNPESKYVMVKFLNGKNIRIMTHVWEIKDKDGKGTREQIPLILAYSLTIHKSQGGTLDYAICDLGPSIFTSGQAYVALSRIRNRKGLFISNFDPNSIMASETALEYSNSLRKKAGCVPKFSPSPAFLLFVWKLIKDSPLIDTSFIIKMYQDSIKS